MKSIDNSASWQSRLTSRLFSAKVPLLFTCLLAFLLSASVLSISAWLTGAKPIGQIDFINAQSSFWLFFVLLFWGLISRSSESALAEIENEIQATEAEFQQLRFRFQIISRSAGWILTGVAIAFLIAGYFSFDTLYPEHLTSIPLYALAVIPWYVVIFSLATAFFALAVKKIRMIGSVLSMAPSVDLFNHAWLSGFARLTLLMSIPFLMGNALTYILNIVINKDYGVAAFFFTFNTLMATGIFVYPLWGIHQRLLKEKGKLKKVVDENISNTVYQLNKQLATKQANQIGSLRDRLNSLRDMEVMIDRESTWPWDTSTLRNFVSAMILPVVLFLLQRILLLLLSL